MKQRPNYMPSAPTWRAVEAEYFRMIRMEQDVEYVRASASLPLVSRIVEIDGKNCSTAASPTASRSENFSRWAMTETSWS